jgi:hypothetical protein
MDKNYKNYMDHFYNFIKEIKNNNIFIDDIEINKIRLKYDEDLSKKIKACADDTYRLPIHIQNTTNLFDHFITIQYNCKKVYDGGLVSNIPVRDYVINNDIILIENRFLIKDITNIYSRQQKLTIRELEEEIKALKDEI